MAGYSGSHSPLPNPVSICLRIKNCLLWSHGGPWLDRVLSKQDHRHQLLPPVGSVLAILAPAQLIPVHLIKLPPANSLFLGCTSQQETARFNPSPTAADGKAIINLSEMRYSLSIPWAAIQLWTSPSVGLDRQHPVKQEKSVWTLSETLKDENDWTFNATELNEIRR